MPREKDATLRDAIGLIDAGSSIALGLSLEHSIPFAVGHELIRQNTDDLTLIGPISDMLFDQLVGASAVSAIKAAWVGNAGAGSGYCFRRAVESGRIETGDHSNLSIALALRAAGMGVPYLPTRSLLGSSILEENSEFRTQQCPFTDDRLVLVPAITPDWTVVHVQRADRYGDAHYWGNTGVVTEAVEAADNVLVTCEELVEPSVIKSDPNRVTITRDQVTRVVECPWGAHPSPVSGHYKRDHDVYFDYHDRTEDPAGFDAWASAEIGEPRDEVAYAERVDEDLRIDEDAYAAEVNYGY